MSQHSYYLLAPGGKTEAKVKKFQAQMVKALKVRNDLIKEFGADGVFGRGGHITGLLFKAKPPAPWRRYRKGGGIEQDGAAGYIVDQKRDPDRKVRGKLDAATVPGSLEFTLHMGGDIFFQVGPARSGGGIPCGFISFETFDGQLVLGIPHGFPSGKLQIPAPKDARELKLSEYYGMRERHEANKEKAKPNE